MTLVTLAVASSILGPVDSAVESDFHAGRSGKVDERQPSEPRGNLVDPPDPLLPRCI
jgi:hypothetical protein